MSKTTKLSLRNKILLSIASVGIAATLGITQVKAMSQINVIDVIHYQTTDLANSFSSPTSRTDYITLQFVHTATHTATIPDSNNGPTNLFGGYHYGYTWLWAVN